MNLRHFTAAPDSEIVQSYIKMFHQIKVPGLCILNSPNRETWIVTTDQTRGDGLAIHPEVTEKTDMEYRQFWIKEMTNYTILGDADLVKRI